MARTLRHWAALLRIYVQDGLAYPATIFIWMLTDAVVTLTMPLVLIAAAQGGSIQGFDAQGFVLYYLVLLVVGSFVTSHFMWEIAFEIKEGQFSAHIIRPVSYYQFIVIRNLAWRVVRVAVTLPMLALLAYAYSGYVGSFDLAWGWQFWTSFVLGHFVSVTFVLAMAMLALFVTEPTSLFELYYVPMLFLSGQLVPVALLPDWARNLAMVFPFYYTTGAPTEILIGRLNSSQATTAIGVQIVWIVGAYLIQRLAWRYGLRYYTGVGM